MQSAKYCQDKLCSILPRRQPFPLSTWRYKPPRSMGQHRWWYGSLCRSVLQALSKHRIGKMAWGQFIGTTFTDMSYIADGLVTTTTTVCDPGWITFWHPPVIAVPPVVFAQLWPTPHIAPSSTMQTSPPLL